MANNNAKGYGVLRFAVDVFSKRALDKMTDEQLVALYEEHKDDEDYCVDYVASLNTFFKALNDDCVDTENYFFYVIPNTLMKDRLSYE